MLEIISIVLNLLRPTTKSLKAAHIPRGQRAFGVQSTCWKTLCLTQKGPGCDLGLPVTTIYLPLRLHPRVSSDRNQASQTPPRVTGADAGHIAGLSHQEALRNQKMHRSLQAATCLLNRQLPRT
ncbi:unnamed protein product [Rangifer tarandus platyrhynchus]|uniref:Uncharacterized protein n=2 Tax=Rangifer tarandus platyrhynchus TaxID=3082113 RepID=A0ABN8YTP4_RANTA|nr:unnamed protein product [Rangifer tarandus platyrhynchus]